MIDKKSVRIGSYVKWERYPEDIYTVVSVDGNDRSIRVTDEDGYIDTADWSMVEGIPLTHALKNLSIPFDSECQGYRLAYNVHLVADYNDEDSLNGFLLICNGEKIGTYVNYLHVFQNVYQFITGKEIEYEKQNN
jgi:hypothetical protein